MRELEGEVRGRRAAGRRRRRWKVFSCIVIPRYLVERLRASLLELAASGGCAGCGSGCRRLAGGSFRRAHRAAGRCRWTGAALATGRLRGATARRGAGRTGRAAARGRRLTALARQRPCGAARGPRARMRGARASALLGRWRRPWLARFGFAHRLLLRRGALLRFLAGLDCAALVGATRALPFLARLGGALAGALGFALGFLQALACPLEFLLGDAHALLGDFRLGVVRVRRHQWERVRCLSSSCAGLRRER